MSAVTRRLRRQAVLASVTVLVMMAVAGCRHGKTTQPTFPLPSSQTGTTLTTVPAGATMSVAVELDGYSYELTASNVSIARDTADASPGYSSLFPTGTVTMRNTTAGHLAPWQQPELAFIWLGPASDCVSAFGGPEFIRDGQPWCQDEPAYRQTWGRSANTEADLNISGAVTYTLDASAYFQYGYSAADTDGIGTGLLPAGTLFMLTLLATGGNPEGDYATAPVPAQWVES